MENNNFCFDKTINSYNKLLSNLKSLFKKNKKTEDFNIDKNKLIENISLFINELDKKNNFEIFIIKNEKLFLKKFFLKEKLFKNIMLKDIFNKDKNKNNLLWKYYIQYIFHITKLKKY